MDIFNSKDATEVFYNLTDDIIADDVERGILSAEDAYEDRTYSAYQENCLVALEDYIEKHKIKNPKDLFYQYDSILNEVRKYIKKYC